MPEERRYFHSWKYLVLISLSKILLNQDHSQPWSDESQNALAALESFVVDSYGSRDPDLTQLFVPERELRLKGSFKIAIGVEAERIVVRELPAHVQQVNRSVQQAVVAALNPEHDYYVCFDQLDLGFTTTDEQYANRLIGLCSPREISTGRRPRGALLHGRLSCATTSTNCSSSRTRTRSPRTTCRASNGTDRAVELTLRDLMERRFGRGRRGDRNRALGHSVR